MRVEGRVDVSKNAAVLSEWIRTSELLQCKVLELLLVFGLGFGGVVLHGSLLDFAALVNPLFGKFLIFFVAEKTVRSVLQFSASLQIRISVWEIC